MKYKDYVKENESIIKPIDNMTPILAVFSTFLCVTQELPEDIKERFEDFIRNEMRMFEEREVKNVK